MLAVTLCLLIINPNVSLANDSSQDINYKEISERMREDGASEENIKSVITKLENGEVLDSNKPISSDKTTNSFFSQEMNETESSLTASLDNPIAIQKFPDGSYNKVGIDFENPEISIMNNTVSLYFNVYASSPTARASFNTSAVIDSHLGPSYITGVSGIDIGTYGGNFLSEKLSIIRATEVRSQGLPAIAELYFKETNFVGSNFSRRLTVEIGNHIADRYGIQVKYSDGNAYNAGYK